MITESILDCICSLLMGVIDLFPTFPVFDFLSDVSVASAFLSWVSWTNYYFPVDRLLNPITTVISAQIIGGIISVLLNLL